MTELIPHCPYSGAHSGIGHHAGASADGGAAAGAGTSLPDGRDVRRVQVCECHSSGLDVSCNGDGAEAAYAGGKRRAGHEVDWGADRNSRVPEVDVDGEGRGKEHK